jgi:hypothetical protein
MMMNRQKKIYDAVSGREIKTGDRYRVHYEGQPHECYTLVVDEACEMPLSPESLTRRSIERGDTDPAHVPPIRTYAG